ncbi:hypothetical protein BKA62DRAFT_818293 [Auriculariales sp. MPI-PUGE-AT-0066]|nr:hypothetical protein BKA62DRAFT_818293 [Auriculariales sp. MPI-PUGE-AT-0066]
MATPSDIAPQLSNPSLKAKPVVILSAGADSRTTSATPAGPHRRKDSKHKKRKVGATPKHHRKQARPSRVAVVVGEPPTAQSRVPFPQPQTYDERGPTSTEQPEKNWSWFWPESKSDRYPPKHPEHYTDFDRKYAPDRYGDEAGDNARVWKIYRDRASAYSGDLIYNWDKMLDILLLFAALFSAVATAFLVESQKSLRPDYEAYMAKQMFATVSAMQGKNVSTAPPTDPSDFKPAMSARWVNGLWFCSLGLALSVSLLATLVKQWLSEFNSGLNDPAASARHWMLRRIVYDTGLTKWRLAVIISALPVILHISLLLFFMGLVVFLWSLDRDIAKLMLAGACAMSTFYLFATFMPLWQIDCPTATPLLRVAQQALLTANEWFQRRFSKLVKRHTYQRIPQDLPSSLHSLRNRAVEEKLRADGSEERLNFQALEWMIATLPAQEEVNSALDAIGSFFPLQPVTIRLSSPPIEKVLVRLGSLAQLERAADPRAISNCLRTAMYLDIPTMVQNSQIPRESFLKPLQQLLANTDGSTTYDVPFLLRHLLAFADRYFDRSHWEVLHACNVEGSPAYNSTNLALALKSCPRVQSPKDLVLLAMVQGFDAILSASPSNRIAMDLIFERCKTQIFSMVGVNSSEEMRGVWNAIAQQQDPGVRFKQLIEFMVAYPELTGLDMDLFAVLFRSFLKLPCLPPGLLDARTRAQRLLAYIESQRFHTALMGFTLHCWNS